MSPMKQSFWQSPLTRSSVPKDKVTTPETLLGYLIGPFGALLSSGIFTSYLHQISVDNFPHLRRINAHENSHKCCPLDHVHFWFFSPLSWA